MAKVFPVLGAKLYTTLPIVWNQDLLLLLLVLPGGHWKVVVASNDPETHRGNDEVYRQGVHKKNRGW